MTRFEQLIRAEWLSGRFTTLGRFGLADLLDRCARIFETAVFDGRDAGGDA